MSKVKGRAKQSKIAIHASSGNVFADLGRPDAEEMLAKSMLAHEISVSIAAAGLNQTQAAKRLGIDQPKVSALLHGRLRGFSTDRLIGFLNALDRDVLITIRPAQIKNHAALRVMAEA